MDKKTAILGIDLQNDFTAPKGSLYVQGADEDMKRTIDFILRNQAKIDYIALTLDSHQPIHVAHQCYWKNKNGNPPTLYSLVTAEAVRKGDLIAQYNVDKALPYLEQLEKQGDACIIWPMHCILGTKGWAINQSLMTCLIDWSIANNKSYELFYKGYAQNTEHYSIFRAAVEWKDQPETCLNKSLLKALNEYDELILVGQAADFCVANSLKDIMKESQELAQKVVILTDCMSWINSDNENAKSIYAQAKDMGVKFKQSTEYSL